MQTQRLKHCLSTVGSVFYSKIEVESKQPIKLMMMDIAWKLRLQHQMVESYRLVVKCQRVMRAKLQRHQARFIAIEKYWDKIA